MFSSGYNTNLEFDKNNKKSIFLLFFGATIIPLLLSIPFISIFQKYFIGENGNIVSFGLVFAIGVAITSIPVISKIFFDIGIMKSKFANLVLTVSTFQDLCLWILLNIATQMATTKEVNIIKMIIISVLTIAFFIITILVTSKIKSLKIKEKNLFSIIFISLFLTIATLLKLGINIMYSAFLVGFVIKSFTANNENIALKIDTFKDITLSLFVPIYFALVGIQLDVIHNFSLFRFVIFFIIAFLLEGLGVVIALFFSNFNKDTIINLAITMNARGGPGIVLATTAYAYEIINLEFFTVLILTTMLSSLIAGSWLKIKNKQPNIYSNLYKE
jgi:Kef-type K+ transport system membrane component KefB